MTELETSLGCMARHLKKGNNTLEMPTRKYKQIKLEPKDKVETENSPGRRVSTFIFKNSSPSPSTSE